MFFRITTGLFFRLEGIVSGVVAAAAAAGELFEVLGDRGTADAMGAEFRATSSFLDWSFGSSAASAKQSWTIPKISRNLRAMLAWSPIARGRKVLRGTCQRARCDRQPH